MGPLVASCLLVGVGGCLQFLASRVGVRWSESPIVYLTVAWCIAFLLNSWNPLGWDSVSNRALGLVVVGLVTEFLGVLYIVVLGLWRTSPKSARLGDFAPALRRHAKALTIVGCLMLALYLAAAAG